MSNEPRVIEEMPPDLEVIDAQLNGVSVEVVISEEDAETLRKNSSVQGEMPIVMTKGNPGPNDAVLIKCRGKGDKDFEIHGRIFEGIVRQNN